MTTEDEDNYFRRHEAERREDRRRALDRASAELAEQRRVAASIGSGDESIVARLRALGFDGDTARVFDLLPLVHVAWADGNVSARERASVLKALEARGIDPDAEAWLLIEALLEKRPTDEFLSETLHLLRDLGAERGTSVVDLCAKIAKASGGFFGLGDRVADEEYEVVARIADALGPAARVAFEQQLG